MTRPLSAPSVIARIALAVLGMATALLVVRANQAAPAANAALVTAPELFADPTPPPMAPGIGTGEPAQAQVEAAVETAPATVPPPRPAPTVKARPVRRPAKPVPPKEAFVVGDSLTVAAQPWLEASFRGHGWRLTGFDAKNGRIVEEGLAVLQAQAAKLPATVVIALGTNNLSASPGTVRSWLQQARAIAVGRRIVWVDLCLDDAASPRLGAFHGINQALISAASEFRIEVAGWCRFSTARGVKTVADGIHYDDTASQVRADFYAAALNAANLMVTAPKAA
jgi:hypothetical protein